MSAERFTDHDLHDLKAALADFFMYMSSIEATIERIFVREFELSSLCAPMILNKIQSVSARWELIQQVLKVRSATEDFSTLVRNINHRYAALRDARNSYAHALSIDEERNCLAFLNRKGKQESPTGPTIVYQLSEARELFHEFTLLHCDYETIIMIEAMTPTDKRVSVIRANYEAYARRATSL